MSKDDPRFKTNAAQFAKGEPASAKQGMVPIHTQDSQDKLREERKIELLAQHQPGGRVQLWTILGRPLLRLSPLILTGIYFLLPGIFSTPSGPPKKRLPLPAMASVGGPQGVDPCQSKKKCLVFFIAPWCPSCHASVGFIQTARNILRERAEIGVRVIVGNAPEREVREFASEIGGPVFVDPTDQFLSKVESAGIPRWWIINAQQEVLASGSGLSRDTDASKVRGILTTEWKL